MVVKRLLTAALLAAILAVEQEVVTRSWFLASHHHQLMHRFHCQHNEGVKSQHNYTYSINSKRTTINGTNIFLYKYVNYFTMSEKLQHLQILLLYRAGLTTVLVVPWEAPLLPVPPPHDQLRNFYNTVLTFEHSVNIMTTTKKTNKCTPEKILAMPMRKGLPPYIGIYLFI